MLQAARQKHRRRNPTGGGRTRCLKGLPWEQVVDAVLGAVEPGDGDLLESILAHVEERGKVQVLEPSTLEPMVDGDGKPVCETHYFFYWLWGLQEGSWNLPVPLPRVVLEGFNARHCAILWRCEDCRTALANAREKWRGLPCPVCGSARQSFKCLAGRHYEYTPIYEGRYRRAQGDS
jgi:hypothetical protein